MKTILLILSFNFLTCSTPVKENFNGHWEGSIISAGKSISIVMDISKDKLVFDIPEMGLFAEPVLNLEISGNELEFEIEGKETISISGKISGDRMDASIDGMKDLEITLNRSAKEPVFYEQTELTYESRGAKISGTLIKPKTTAPFPVIMFVHGSGKMTRETMRSRAYLFVKNGIAAFIFDRRGKGKSEGDTSRILPIAVMTSDVIAGVQMLKTRSDINKDQIGLYGLSQGAWVVPNAASLCKDVKFLITISAPGITPDQQNDFVVNNIVEKYANKYKKEVKIPNHEKVMIDSLAPKFRYEKPVSSTDSVEIVPGFSSFDPIPVWEKIDVPVLAVWGAEDEIVPAEQSKLVIENALLKAGNKNYSMKIFEGADHSLRLADKNSRFAGAWPLTAAGSNEFLIEWVKKIIQD